MIAPVFQPLGFGDWRAATALVTGLLAKETVLSTLGVLLGGELTAALPQVRRWCKAAAPFPLRKAAPEFSTGTAYRW